MKLSPSLLLSLSTIAFTILDIKGFVIQPKQSVYGRNRQGPVCAIDPSVVDQLAQIDPSVIQSQVSSALPDLPQVMDSSGLMLQVEKISSVLANNVAIVNCGIGVGSFLLGSAVSGRGNAEIIEGLEKSIADKESIMQDLQTKLGEAQKSEEDLNTKITQFEEQMFETENEYEMETGKMKKKFQADLEKEKDKVRTKIKKEMQFSMDIKMNKERSNMLQEKLEFVKEISFEKNAELAELRFENAEMERQQRITNTSLQKSEEEVVKLLSLKNKDAFWPSEVFGLRIQQSQSEKDIERLTQELEEMEIGLAEANEEIQAFNSKRNFWSFISKESKDTSEK